MAERVSSRTEANLLVALAGEADANRRYVAYGFQALNEGYPEIAQLFFEAAGAETVHALVHLRAMGAIGPTKENLERAATGEVEEIEVILPRMIRDAEADGRPDAAASFRLALDRERHHRDMFRAALAAFERGDHARKSAAGHLTETGPPRAQREATPPVIAGTPAARGATASPSHAGTTVAVSSAPHARSVDGRANVSELATEPERIARLSNIREFVFGAQDGLVSTLAVVAGMAAAGANHLVVMLAGAISAVAGVLSMSIGTFLSSRALRQAYEGELARERREIREHPGEETAELIASLMSRGMSRADAVEVGRRIARHPELLLTTLGVFELGLAPQRLGRPLRDAFVMAAAFGGASMVPVLAFIVPNAMVGLGLAAALTVVALFVVGAVKGYVAGVSRIRSGLEVVVLGLASGVIGFGLGRLASVVLGIQVT